MNKNKLSFKKTKKKKWKTDAELLDAILLPSALAITKVSGHSKPETTETKGNSWADHTTKTAVLQNGDSQLTAGFFQSPSNLTDTLLSF